MIEQAGSGYERRADSDIQHTGMATAGWNAVLYHLLHHLGTTDKLCGFLQNEGVSRGSSAHQRWQPWKKKKRKT
jgi:hypothetical protein